MSCVTMIKEIKSIHPKDVALIKLGSFYRVYGKDAYLVSNIFEYKLKEEHKIPFCGFPIKSINRVKATLENKKINYMIIDSRDNYDINEKEDFKNLNNYDKEFLKSKKYVENKIKIENIYEYMNANSKKEEIKIILKEFEEIINAKGKI